MWDHLSGFFVRFVAFYWIFFRVRGTFLKLNMGNFVFLLWVGFKAPARRAPKRYSSAARRHIVHLATRKNILPEKHRWGRVEVEQKGVLFFQNIVTIRYKTYLQQYNIIVIFLIIDLRLRVVQRQRQIAQWPGQLRVSKSSDRFWYA